MWLPAVVPVPQPLVTTSIAKAASGAHHPSPL
jgi:hypothetical protein